MVWRPPGSFCWEAMPRPLCGFPGSTRNAFADIFLCFLPLIVNGALLLNAITPDWRKNAFWMLLALGCSLWMAGQSIWTYVEVYQHRHIPDPFIGDIVFFLHTVPMIAALTMQPHTHPDDRKTLYGYVDFGLMLCWWVYLYVFVVLPWQYVVIDSNRYVQSYTVISGLENFVFVGSAFMLATKASGRWRRIYAHLAGAGATYTFGRLLIELSFRRNIYPRASLYNLPLLISFLWLGTAGIVAYQSRGDENKFPAQTAAEKSAGKNSGGESVWASHGERRAPFTANHRLLVREVQPGAHGRAPVPHPG